MEYLHCSNINCSKLDRPLQVATKWEPPTIHQLKLNIDGPFKSRFALGGMGGVFRDSTGNWILGFSKTITGPSPLYIELEALCQGLELAVTYQFRNLQIETDSASVPSLIESNYSSLYNALLCKCRYWLKMLGNPPILHNFREGNNIAHDLAHQGIQQANVHHNQIYLEVPDYLTEAVRADKEGITVTRTTTTNTPVLNNLAMLGNPAMSSFGCNATSNGMPSSAPNGRTRPCNYAA
ncbi:putative ribonuclease h protein [Nicotiana attenuata]|uniref:Ribonuclease h protein n=1 Tax=Nicotiana attenuata TaxID=49451 RepID=A0A314KKE0_NICAT|nr:putative ribonuclease h protein [Nicotiana attenuata]